MTKRDFFILLIKILGLYFLISSLFSVLPGNISYVLTNIEWIGILWLLITVVIGVGLFAFLLFRSHKISDLLKLEKGFDKETIDFGGLKSVDILKMAIILMGGFLFIENIPSFLSHTLFAFKSSIPQGFDQVYESNGLLKYTNPADYIRWGSSAMNLIIGFTLITNFKKISVFIDKKVKE